MSSSKRTEKFFVAEPGFGTNLQSLNSTCTGSANPLSKGPRCKEKLSHRKLFALIVFDEICFPPRFPLCSRSRHESC